MEDGVLRPASVRRRLSACRPTGARRAVRVAVAAPLVVLPLVASIHLGFGTAHLDACGHDGDAGGASVFLLGLALGAIVALRYGWPATLLTGLGALLVVVIAAATARHGDHVLSGFPLTYGLAVLLVVPAALLLMLIDPVLHALERWHLEVDVDPVVAVAELYRGR